MTIQDQVRVSEQVVVRRVGDDTVLLNLKSRTYFGLNPVGGRIWELIAEKGTLQAVLEKMADEYEATPEELQQDILRLVEELRENGLVEVAGKQP